MTQRLALKSAELWVHKAMDPNDANRQTFTVTPRNLSIGERYHKKLAVIQTNVSYGWLQFPLRHSVQSWWKEHHKNDTGSMHKHIRVTCKTCTADPRTSPISHHGEYRPFIMIHLKPDKHHRAKRSSKDCVAGLRSCCRERIRFSFAQIGWNWVQQPKDYNGYYCKGSCRGMFIL